MARSVDIEKIDWTRKPVKAKKYRTYIAETRTGKVFEFESAYRKGSWQNDDDAFFADGNPNRERIVAIRTK